VPFHSISIALAFRGRSGQDRLLQDPGVDWAHDGVVDGVFEDGTVKKPRALPYLADRFDMMNTTKSFMCKASELTVPLSPWLHSTLCLPDGPQGH
jgi:hypothetical protein